MESVKVEDKTLGAFPNASNAFATHQTCENQEVLQKSIQSRKRENCFSDQYVLDNTEGSHFTSLDHCYSKIWNSQSEYSCAQTAKIISWLDIHKQKPPIKQW